MVSRGEVGLIVAGVGLSEGLIGSNTYSIMVLMVLATTIITPLSLKLAYCKPKEEAGAAPSGAVLVKTTSTNSEMEEASHGKDARGFRNAVKRKPTLPE
jgi:Kef-type K+ transport system membrane component KefB